MWAAVRGSIETRSEIVGKLVVPVDPEMPVWREPSAAEVAAAGIAKLMPDLLADAEELVAATPEWSNPAKLFGEMVGKFTVTDSDGNVLAEAENKIVTTCFNDVISVKFPEPVQCNNGDTITTKYTVGYRGEDMVGNEPGEKSELEVAAEENKKKKSWSKQCNEIIREELDKRVPKAAQAVNAKLKAESTAAKLKVHQPEPEPAPKKVYGTYEDIVFDEDLLAKMMANMNAHSMTLEDLAG